MPGLVRKLLISAGAQGLLLQPVGSHHHSATAASPVSISYDTTSIVLASGPNALSDVKSESLEAHGIIGILDLVLKPYLIVITRRELVAHIRQKAIYLITEVSLIPLTSLEEAQKAISKACRARRHRNHVVAEDDYNSDSEDDSKPGSVVGDNDVAPVTPAPADNPPEKLPTTSKPDLFKRSTTFVSDVILDRGKYGRFADKWFSNAGWTARGRSRQGMSTDLSDTDSISREQRRQGLQNVRGGSNNASPTRADVEMVEMSSDGKKNMTQSGDGQASAQATLQVMQNLIPRIVTTTKLFFASRSFYFSYDFDLTRSLKDQQSDPSALHLCKRLDPSFFWNHHLVQPFADASQYALVLPIMQGFVGQESFTPSGATSEPHASPMPASSVSKEIRDANSSESNVSSHGNPPTTREFLLTLISRRSVERAGLRYLRRGVDDQGNVANYVETEQILSSSDWNAESPILSLMQVRGSIPLFFSQSPYSFKPVPITYGSEDTNRAAFDRHFDMLRRRFGDVAINSLVDKHSTEASIGELYQHHVDLANSSAKQPDAKKLGFEWFDFHHICRGMKFENVALLIDTLAPVITHFGWWQLQGDALNKQQKGIMRTNCMDCLDRTNVVQSAIAGRVLETQLQSLGLTIDLKQDPKTQWFNSLWADNGDAVSRQYAGTAALKGDYTRNRKRAWTGALSDFSLTLNRFYNNIFGDYFLQTCIDYYQGHGSGGGGTGGSVGAAAANIYVDFENDMMTSDYAIDTGKLRQSAIESCVKIVLEDPDKEDLVWAWTLSAPLDDNTLRTNTKGVVGMEECVVLLTAAGLYKVQFDWATEKVRRFQRVDLTLVRGLQRGVYITSTFGAGNLDESRNRGFTLKYRCRDALSGSSDDGESGLVRTNTRSMSNEKKKKEPRAGSTDRVLLFKALSSANDGPTEAELVYIITDEICRLANAAMDSASEKEPARDDASVTRLEVEERDVVSVARAKSATSYLESLGYSLKKLVWS